MNTKICSRCKKEKSVEEFNYAKKRKGTNFTTQRAIAHRGSQCRQCCAEYAKEFRKRHKNYRGSGLLKKYPKEHRLLISAIRHRISDAKGRTKKAKGKLPECTISADYMFELFNKQQGKCALSGVPLKLEVGSLTVLSIDKIRPEKGYTIGNVQWVAWAVNRAKGEMSQQMFLDMCKKVSESATTIPQGSTP